MPLIRLRRKKISAPPPPLQKKFTEENTNGILRALLKLQLDNLTYFVPSNSPAGLKAWTGTPTHQIPSQKCILRNSLYLHVFPFPNNPKNPGENWFSWACALYTPACLSHNWIYGLTMNIRVVITALSSSSRVLPVVTFGYICWLFEKTLNFSPFSGVTFNMQFGPIQNLLKSEMCIKQVTYPPQNIQPKGDSGWDFPGPKMELWMPKSPEGRVMFIWGP